MFIVLYRWRPKNGMEERLVAAWTEVTEELLKNHGSLGSRLHRGDDGIWYAYAQWRSADDRERAFASAQETDARRAMRESIGESFPEIILEPLSDLLIRDPA